MARKKLSDYLKLAFYGAVIFAIISLYFFIKDNPDFLVETIKKYGVVGLFIAAIVANSTVILPLPLDILIAFVGANPALFGFEAFSFFEIIFLAVLIGLGAAIGEMGGYILGLTGANFTSQIKIKNAEKIQEIERVLRQSGMVFIFLGAIIPFPFDLIGIAAGLLKYDFKKFFLATFFGRSIRYFIILFAIKFGLSFVSQSFAH